ncbi:MAG: DUF2892 domain-containing protein [Paracoccaceae bacterium]
MTRNMGRLDRWIRLAAGLVLVGFALFCPFAADLGPVVVWGSGMIGAVMLVTAAVGICPLYSALGLRT